MKTTIKKVDLAESVKNALATTKSAGMEAVETVFTEIAKALAEGNTGSIVKDILEEKDEIDLDIDITDDFFDIDK